MSVGKDFNDRAARRAVSRGLQVATYAGPNSQAVDHGAMRAALDALDAGENKYDVWDKHGWYVDKKGDAKYEIDDSKAKFNWEKFNERSAEPTYLQDVLDHPGLYEAYPQLRGVKVKMSEYLPYGTAAVNKDREIEFGRLGRRTPGLLMHEIQHLIQDIEGFAPGASFYLPGYDESAGEAEAYDVMRRFEQPKTRTDKMGWGRGDARYDGQPYTMGRFPRLMRAEDDPTQFKPLDYEEQQRPQFKAQGGAVRGNGISSAVRMVEGYGRGPDTMLAHISPDEAMLVDYLQGGRRVNPTTGLAEYGLFGKILKGLARAAGGIVGGMLGGPAGAALGAGMATKLTGGSWKDSLLAGGLSGIGAGVGNMAAGRGFMGTTGLSGAAANSVPLSKLGQVASETVLPTGMLGGINAATAGIGGLGGVGAGIGGFMAEPREEFGQPGVPQMPPPPDANITYNPNAAPSRTYVPYEGDYSTFGERGGGHRFFKPNVPGLGMAAGGRASAMARAGRVRGPSDGSGMDDRVPAMLTAGEHVLDQEYVKLKGKGSVERGHQAIEREKRKVRRAAGIPAPYKPAAARAKMRAGVR